MEEIEIGDVNDMIDTAFHVPIIYSNCDPFQSLPVGLADLGDAQRTDCRPTILGKRRVTNWPTSLRLELQLYSPTAFRNASQLAGE